MTVRALKNLVVVEDDAAGMRIEADNLARDENFGAEAFGLPKRPARELGARDAARKAQIILDSRRRLRLASRRLLFDHDRAQALRGPVDSGGEACRSPANDDRIVVLKARRGLKAEPSRELAGLRPDQFRPVGEPQSGAIVLVRRRPRPVIGQIWIVDRQPAEGNLVALEKTAQVEAGGAPTRSQKGDMSGVRLRRELLQTPDALAGQFVHPPHKLRRRGGDVVIEPGVDLHDPRRLAGPESGLKLRAIDKRNFAEEIVPQAHSELALDAVDELDDFDRALEHDKQSRRFALIDRVFAGAEIDVRSRPRDIGQRDWRKRGKDRNRGKFVWRQHALPALPAQSENAGAFCGRVRRSVKPPTPPRTSPPRVPAKEARRRFDPGPDAGFTVSVAGSRQIKLKYNLI